MARFQFQAGQPPLAASSAEDGSVLAEKDRVKAEDPANSIVAVTEVSGESADSACRFY